MGNKSNTGDVNQKKSVIKKTIDFFKDERFKIILFILLLALAIYLSFAFISYLFTWKQDQSFSYSEVISGPEITVDNWAGKQGAELGRIFLGEWFGIASFIIPFLLVLIAFKLIDKNFLPFWKSIRISLIGIILLSVTLGFVSGDTEGYLGSGLGGFHGYVVSQWLTAIFGSVGTILILFVLLSSYIIFSIPSSTTYLKKFFYHLFNMSDHINVFKGNKNEGEDVIEFDDDKEVKEDEENNVSGDGDEEEAQTQKDNAENDGLIFETGQANDEDDISSVKEEDTGVKNDVDAQEEVELTVEEHNEEEETTEMDQEQLEDYDPTLELSDFKLPPLDMLEKHEVNNTAVSDEELVSNKNKIVETLANYKIQINKIRATIGPTVTLYEIVPAPGIRISKIKNLEDDIALSLAALGIRIIAPIPGKGTIGIEVPNQNPQIVSMRSVLNSKKFREANAELAIAIGKTVSNETFVFDLAKMPHLLVAGATGQGKSVGLNAIITSLLYKKHPAQLKFVFIDPKKVELSIYSKIQNHYLAMMPDTEEPIITDTQKVINTLNSLTVEMDERYNLLKKAKVRNIKEYNNRFISRRLNPEKGHRYLPYIVLVIDEFADLIMTAGKEVENPLARLAQLARAIGIHLIIATQRPTTNIITGVIKANFPARIGFKVSSMVDSRTILDSPGANQLIGRGDMLITSSSELVRVQCAFVDTEEIEKINDFISEQRGFPSAFMLPEYQSEESSGVGDVDLNKKDALFEEAARLVVIHQQGSTSLIQRKFSIGYNRAGRIIDQLEAAGIVGPFEGSKARQVLFSDEYSLEQHLNNMNT